MRESNLAKNTLIIFACIFGGQIGLDHSGPQKQGIYSTSEIIESVEEDPYKYNPNPSKQTQEYLTQQGIYY